MLLRVIKYVLLTKNKVLRFKVQNRRPILRGFSDSDWAGDKDDHRSITGYCVYFMDCLVAWKLRAQKNVTLSSSEAEYVAVLEICSEIKLIKMILTFLKIEIEEPVKIYCDNVGAIFMSHNAKLGAQTKHIDIKYHFIREQVENGTVEIVFVRSEENDADIFLKMWGKCLLRIIQESSWRNKKGTVTYMDYENGKGVGKCIFIVWDTYEDIVEETILIWYTENDIKRKFAENCRVE